MYKESIPRRDLEDKAVPDDEIDERSHSAHAELRSYELMYLSLTVLSPFLGATLLRIVATAITGDADTLSWFSTSLFVLATGIRPWTHLVDRLKSRSQALNDILKEDEDGEGSKYSGEEVFELRSYMQALDERLLRLSDKGSSDVRDMYEHLQGVVDGVDRTLRRHRAELAKATQSQNARVAVLEARLNGIDLAVEKSSYYDGREGLAFPPAREVWHWILHSTWSAWVYAAHMTGVAKAPPPRGSGRNLKLMGPSGSPPSRRSSRLLEPIAEEDVPLATHSGPVDAGRNEDKPQTNGAVSRRRRRNSTSRHWAKEGLVTGMRFLLSPFALMYRVASLILAVPHYFVRAIFS